MSEPKNSDIVPRSGLLSHLIRLLIVLLLGIWMSQQFDLKALPKDLFEHGVSVLIVAVLGGMNLGIAAVRWRFLMTGFNANALPPSSMLFRLNLVGHFYNIFVPGAVGGDLARAHIAGICFGSKSESYFVVVAERMLGLGALGIFFAVGLIFGQGSIMVEAAGLWVVGLSSLVICVLAVGLLGRRLTRWWRSAPTLTQPMYVLYATVLSLFTHSVTIIGFWILTRSMNLDVTLLDLTVIVPVALVASVVPLAIAGVGPREVALVALIPLLNLGTEEQALLLSVGFAASNWVLGGCGGLLQLMIGRQAFDIDGPWQGDAVERSDHI
ncbi:MAG: lysylphosphatidylglycerol synthase transmembrane domain-containing protein [Bradymonadia bacterium]